MTLNRLKLQTSFHLLSTVFVIFTHFYVSWNFFTVRKESESIFIMFIFYTNWNFVSLENILKFLSENFKIVNFFLGFLGISGVVFAPRQKLLKI